MCYKIEAVHECSSDAWDIMDGAIDTPDGRPDFQERKYCNYMTATYENCTNIISDCFPQEEINFWIDNNLSNYMDVIKEIYSNWDSFHDCRQNLWQNEKKTEDDGRPDFEERKRCNFETSWPSTYPDKLLGACKTEEDLKRMQSWELVSDKFEHKNWDTDKCPAVKESVTSWNDLKRGLVTNLFQDQTPKKDQTTEQLILDI